MRMINVMPNIQLYARTEEAVQVELSRDLPTDVLISEAVFDHADPSQTIHSRLMFLPHVTRETLDYEVATKLRDFWDYAARQIKQPHLAIPFDNNSTAEIYTAEIWAMFAQGVRQGFVQTTNRGEQQSLETSINDDVAWDCE